MTRTLQRCNPFNLTVEFNHIFLFIAVITPLMVLARAWRPGGPYHGWRVASLIVLGVTALAWIFFRDHSGFIGGVAWFVLLFIPAVGLKKVTELAAHHRFQAARRLAAAIQIVHPSRELREQVQLFRTLESEQESGFVHSPPVQPQPARQDRQRPLRGAPAVIIFILLNAAVFLVEMSFGDFGDAGTLHRLGALEPYSVVVLGEYWRLITALFLHAGVTHLFFNLFALYMLGPGLERAIGSARFAVAYLISGLGSSVGVVVLSLSGFIRPVQVVGASGCVLGIVGAWAGFLLRHRHVPRARERLLNILVIVAIQTAFDLTTPQVSTAAHICGLVTGLFVGLIIAPSRQ